MVVWRKKSGDEEVGMLCLRYKSITGINHEPKEKKINRVKCNSAIWPTYSNGHLGLTETNEKNHNHKVHTHLQIHLDVIPNRKTTAIRATNERDVISYTSNKLCLHIHQMVLIVFIYLSTMKLPKLTKNALIINGMTTRIKANNLNQQKLETKKKWSVSCHHSNKAEIT